MNNSKSSGYDLKDIKVYYSQKSDYELIQITTERAQGLRPGIFEIIEKEIKKRNLNPALLESVKAQNRSYTFEEIVEFSQKLRTLPCPICKDKAVKLNGTVIYTVKSYIFSASLREELVIGCPNCLDIKNKEAIISTALLGWWSGTGLINTPISIYTTIREKRWHRIPKPNDALLRFTSQNIGQIVAYKDDPEQLIEIIRYKG
ncbi:hypothetical protein [Flavobacterium cerinum]|uniref:Uncharacterized protein n=1 Tax=Flavobacterium cerinum TaxID=2502784 RepID=A0ABY5IT10_9FLAO|nr:hypothetical protein [Flavobacterium cerinum]UUC44509.1 hypothetical protein NOX80_12810 [Flavobacterium cerinum]